jgi:hypothetical protein
MANYQLVLTCRRQVDYIVVSVLKLGQTDVRRKMFTERKIMLPLFTHRGYD